MAYVLTQLQTRDLASPITDYIALYPFFIVKGYTVDGFVKVI